MLLLLALLSVLVVPAMAQEGVAPLKPLAGDTSQKSLTGAACTPLSYEEQAIFDKLAQVKATGELIGSDYELFLKLGEQASCANTPAAPDAISAVSGYAFTQSSGSYTALVGGTTPSGWTNTADDDNFNALAIGFSFNYNGTSYTQFSIQNNGFISMGASVTNSYLPISGGSTNNVISVLGRDLVAQTGANLSYLTSGSAPNRVLTVEWLNYKKYLGTGDSLSFQIKLYETSNVIEYVYGGFTIGTANTTYPQVGLRGASSADFNNRTTTTNWSASTAGGTNTATMTLTVAVKPASGQTYAWTPPSGPPSCATSPSPATAATNVAIPTSLGWSAGVGGGLPPTSYDVYFGTSATPPFVVNVAASPYNPGALAYSTLYYWQIVPKNAIGPATGCPVWSFTTVADPTVTIFPYSQDFNGATFPGWTVEIPVVAEAPNASSPLIGTSTETSYGKVNNLTVNAGATLELASVNNLKVEGTLTNNGWLKQTKFAANGSLTEFLRVKNVAGTVDKYSGVDLTPTSITMGDTVVIVKGNQECPQANAPANTVNRCYEITPTTVGPAITRFYFDSAERGSLVLANLNGWHDNTGTSAFDLLPATANPPGGSGAREYVEATTTTYSPFAVASGNPLAVTLASFGAQGSSDRVVVSWETLNEANNAGFNVYRADNDAGPQTLLAYVPSQGPGSTQGYAYTYDDLAVQPNQTYWYWLEDVSLSGATTLHGPVSATVSAPTAVTLASLQATPAAPAIPAAAAVLASLAGLMAAAGVAVRRRAR